jgi:hypothetical protein
MVSGAAVGDIERHAAAHLASATDLRPFPIPTKFPHPAMFLHRVFWRRGKEVELLVLGHFYFPQSGQRLNLEVEDSRMDIHAAKTRRAMAMTATMWAGLGIICGCG